MGADRCVGFVVVTMVRGRRVCGGVVVGSRGVWGRELCLGSLAQDGLLWVLV